MRPRALLCAFAAAALCGCSGLPPSASPPTSPSNELVGYFAAVARMAPAEQRKALAQAAEAWKAGPTPYARAKLGGLYAQPAAALRDDARALSLLEPLAAGAKRDPAAGPDAGFADLASLLFVQVAERQRAAREEAKRQDVLRESNDSMKERLEAMKAIERSIQQREERQRTR